MSEDQEKFEEYYFNKIGMCGCGNPEKVKEFIFRLLKNHHNYKESEIDYDKMIENRKQIFQETSLDTIFEFVFHVLENADLLEHGGSVYSSWLTEEGEEFLRLLQKFKDEDLVTKADP